MAYSGFIAIGLLATPTFASTPTGPGLNLSLTCPNGSTMYLSSTPKPAIYAAVLKFVPQAVAEQRIANTEQKKQAVIDPAYANNQRVIVMDKSGRQYLVVVPKGMVVHIGEGVSFIPSHGDPNNLCDYIPNLIIP